MSPSHETRPIASPWMGLVAFAVVFLIASRAPAGPDPSEDAIRRGVELRKQGQDEQALREFSKAYEVSRTPRALAQIGLAEQALGRWVEAETHLMSALRATADSWIQKNRAALQGALDTVGRHLGSLEVLGEPRGAEVRVQGNMVGQMPLEEAVRVPNGEIVVEVRHSGYRMTSRTVTISAGEMSRETIVLVPITPETRGHVDTSGSAGDNVAAGRLSDSARREPLAGSKVAEATPWYRPAKWTAAGLAFAALTLGVVETVVAVRRSNDFNSLPELCTDDGHGHIQGGPRCEKADHEQQVATWVAGISYGLGAVLAGTAVVLHLAEPRRSIIGGSARLACGAAGAFTGVTCVAHW